MMTISRRRFLQGTALIGAAAPSLATFGAARGAETPAVDLAVETRQIEIAGRAATVFGLRLPDGRQGLTTTTGEDFAVRLHNRLAEPTLVHWHGLTPPWRQDGVPGLSQDPLAPGQSYDYRFPVTPAGTHWMHSHQGLQEQALLAAPLIVRDPAEADRDEQEVVVLLHDFSFRPAEEILAELQTGGGAAHDAAAPATGSMSGAAGHGAAQPAATGEMKAHMDANAGMDMGTGMDMGAGMDGAAAAPGMDLNDVAYDAYLANDRTLDDPEVVPVEAGGRVRLRLINGAAATNFTLDLGSLAGELVAVDGNAVMPARGRQFPLAIAQRLDVVVTLPSAGGAFPVLFLREGDRARSGIVLATKGAPVTRLAPLGGVAGPVLDLSLERRLRAAQPLAARPADRSIDLDLTGSMAGYRWGLEQAGAAGGGPLRVRHGERVEIVLRNRTMMSHPMHLHGHHFQVVAIDGERLPGAKRDTVLVPPRARITIAFEADNPGRWAFHCHNLYHMAVGMMTTVAYDGIG